MDLLATKLISVLVVFSFGLVGVFLPWMLRSGKRSDYILSAGNAFAGGVLLGAGLIHMMGDATDSFASLWPEVDFPFAFLTAGLGFLTILLIERVAMAGKPSILEAQEKSGKVQDSKSGILYPVILFVALSVHSMFAGLAMGLQGSAQQAMVILIAIIAHKTVASFALGVSWFRLGAERKEVAGRLIAFAAVTPVGILLGSAVHMLTSGRMGTEVQAVFDALAAGTFLYIAAIDVMAEEFVHPGHRVVKFICCASGFGIMAVVAIWT